MTTKDSCKGIGKILKFWILGFLPLTLAIQSIVSDCDMEIRNHLKKLNKPYVKSIKSPDGDIIDCVPINLQPAFDNPLLKNHTIQMQPSSYPEGFSRKLSSTHEKPITQLWQTKGRCPKGTIPIRRTSEEDLLRANSIQSYGKKTPQTIPNPKSPPSSHTNAVGHEYAVRSVGGTFYGAKAALNVWNPSVQEDYEFSLAQIWVLAGPFELELNTIEAGWQIDLCLYGDKRTRLFGYWTRDAYTSTGCYNLLCSAFVQIDRAAAFGASIAPISSYNGDQYEISLFIYKDPESGNWWLYVGDEALGYWPSTLFTHLQDFASDVEWGGEIVNHAVGGEHTTTQMGSGGFSGEGFKRAAYFLNLQVVDGSYALITPDNFQTTVTDPDCYDLTPGKTDQGEFFFFFGGPGRSPSCP